MIDQKPEWIDAERDVMSAAIESKDEFCRVASVIETSDLHDPRNQIIWKTIQKVVDQGSEVTSLTVAKGMTKKELSQAGGYDHLTELYRSHHGINPAHHAAIVRRASITRQIAEMLQSSVDDLDDGEDVETVVQNLVSAFDLASTVESVKVVNYLQESFNEVAAIQDGERKGKVDLGLVSMKPFAPAPNEFVIMAARPSVGKTALAIWMAERLARTEPVLFISAEMSRKALAVRRVAAMTGISGVKILEQHGLNGDEMNRVVKAYDDLSKSNLIVIDKVTRPDQVLAEIRKHKVKDGITAAFVDHLHILSFPGRKSLHEEIGGVTKSMARLTKELEMNIYLLSQLNRGYEQRDGNEPPVLSDLRGSGSIEEDLDICWLLHRPEMCNPEADPVLTVKTGKNRNGPIGEAHLEADMPTGRFGDWDGLQRLRRKSNA